MKECCANCRHFEDCREISEPAELGTGYCDYDAEIIQDDPEELTCFNFVEK